MSPFLFVIFAAHAQKNVTVNVSTFFSARAASFSFCISFFTSTSSSLLLMQNGKSSPFLVFFHLHALSKSLPSLDSFRRLIPHHDCSVHATSFFFLPATFPRIFDFRYDVLNFSVLERTTLTCSDRYLSIFCAFVVSSTEIDARGLPCLV